MRIGNKRWILMAAMIVASPFFLQAQEAEKEEEGDEDIEVLSPFVVEETENVGYLATSTLAGTRLKTNLEDVGAAISVFTEEFIEDVGATDAESLLTYAVNVETGGMQGNFADGALQDSTRTNPQNAQRVRGLNAATLTRNYFTTDIPFDTYNTHSVTINRGPNSLLFGIGSAGGIIDNSLRGASVLKNSGEVSVRVGERGSYRTTADVNLVAIPDRWAVRATGLYEDTDYQQRPAFEQDERFFLSTELVLHEGKKEGWFGRTTVRANYENGKITSNRPNVVPPIYGFENWFDGPDCLCNQDSSFFLDHNTVSARGDQLDQGQFFWLGNDPNLGYPKAVFNSNRPHEFIHHRAPYDIVEDDEVIQGFLSDGTFVDHPDVPPPLPINQNLNFNSIGTPVTLNFFGQIALIIPDHTVPTFGTWDATRGFHGQQGASFDFKPRGPAMRGWPTVYTSTQHQLSRPGFITPSMPLEMLDNNNLLLTGSGNRVIQDFDATDFSFEQLFFDGKAGFEIGYHTETYDTEADLTFSPEIGAFANSRNIRIDLNIWQRDGAELNPHLGRAFMTDFGGDRVFTQTDRESFRTNAFFELDLTEREGGIRHFGRHVVSGLYLKDERTFRRQQRRFHWGDDVTGGGAEARAFPGQVLGSSNRQVRSAVYFGPSMLGDEFQRPTDFTITEPIIAPELKEGDVYRLQFINPGFGFGGYGEGEFPVVDILRSTTSNKVEVESYVFAYQGFFFEEMPNIPNVAFIYGYRDDESKQFLSRNSDPSFSSNLTDGTADPAGGELQADHEEPVSGTTSTKSVVVTIPDSWNPFSDFVRFSGHWSESENFQPTSLRRNILNEVLAPPTGETRDYGFSMHLLENRLSVRFNWYETDEVDQPTKQPPV